MFNRGGYNVPNVVFDLGYQTTFSTGKPMHSSRTRILYQVKWYKSKRADLKFNLVDNNYCK
jgi:hypothetical protein